MVYVKVWIDEDDYMGTSWCCGKETTHISGTKATYKELKGRQIFVHQCVVCGLLHLQWK
jgi:cytochrome c